MTILRIVVELVKAIGTRIFVAWLTVTFVIALVYRMSGHPLEGRELSGMILVSAIAVLAAWQVGRIWNRRHRPSPTAQLTANGRGSRHDNTA